MMVRKGAVRKDCDVSRDIPLRSARADKPESKSPQKVSLDESPRMHGQALSLHSSGFILR